MQMKNGTEDTEKMKINLGCGDKKMHGWINADCRKECEPDLVIDSLKAPWPGIDHESVDVIYACHVLEHIPKDELYDTLTSWHFALKDNGILKISVPSFDSVVNHYIRNRNLKLIESFLHGGQKYPEDLHYTSWNREKLEEVLRFTGFKNFVEWNWKSTEHSYIDDYSQAYLPHMDKIHGMQMSLNIECTK